MKNKTIGLALSGGGHRATIFALGALLYLVDSGRNKDVKTISSVSGGSITNAFLATLDKPFNDETLTPEEFEQEVASLAKQIAGSPTWWKVTWITYTALLGLWAVQTFNSFPVNLWSEYQLLYIPLLFLWAKLIGPRSGGTLWAWWGTWMYVGLLIPATILIIASLWSPLPHIYSFFFFLVLSIALYLRNEVADIAFNTTICSSPLRGANQHTQVARPVMLSDLPKDVRHVFCATEAHTGHHAYFSHDLIYAPFFGVGQPYKFRLSTAIQTSANFPIGFPYRLLKKSQHEFHKNDHRYDSSVLMLSDGGIYDNTGVSWYLETNDRLDETSNIQKWKDHMDSSESVSEQKKQRVLTQLHAMKSHPDQLIVINSSAPPVWQSFGTSLLPIIGELVQVFKLPDILYLNKGRQQSKDLERLCFTSGYTGNKQGAVISIDEVPSQLLVYFGDPINWDIFSKDKYPQPQNIKKDFISRAKKIKKLITSEGCVDFRQDQLNLIEQRDVTTKELKDMEKELNYLRNNSVYQKDTIKECEDNIEYLKGELSLIEQDLKYPLKGTLNNSRRAINSFKLSPGDIDIEESRKYSTTLRPLGKDKTAHLLWHGYLMAMVKTSLMLEGFPVVESAPPSEDFHALASGKKRSCSPEMFDL